MDWLETAIVSLAVLALAWGILVVVLWVHRPSRALTGSAIRLVPELIGLVRSLLADGTTPRSVKIALWGLFAYLLSPIDLVPDFIPVLGSIDDLIVAALVLRWAGRRVGPRALRDHWTGSGAGFELLSRLLAG